MSLVYMFGNTIPAAGGGGPNIVFHDSFTDTGSTLLSAHTPEVGSWITPNASFISAAGTHLEGANYTSNTAGLGQTDFEMLVQGIDASAAFNWAFRIGSVAADGDSYVATDSITLYLSKTALQLSTSGVSRATVNHAASWGSNWSSTESLIRMKRIGSLITFVGKKNDATAYETEGSFSVAPGVSDCFPLLRTTSQTYDNFKVSDNPSATEWLL